MVIDGVHNQFFAAEGNQRIHLVAYFPQRLFNAERFDDTVDI